MSEGIYRGIVVPHAPRLGLPALVPDFQRDLVAGIKEMGADIRADEPDVMIVCSTHYVSTFNWHACMVAEHKGRCVAMEAPDMIAGEPYRYRGDADLGRAVGEEIRALDLPCIENRSEHFHWDYGTWVPVHYLDPDADLPIITVPVVLAADLDETYAVGRAIDRACRKAGRRAVMVASSALAHKLIRNPGAWPTEERQQADRRLVDMLLAGKPAAAWDWLPDYVDLVVAEMGGRALALMLGGLAASADGGFETAQFGPYGQSSGSGNANLSLRVA